MRSITIPEWIVASNQQCIRLTNVRREKGRAIQWEEDIPPGNCCSSRKQSERSGLVTVQHGASDAEGPARPDQRALRP